MNSSSAGDPGIRLEIHPGDAAWKQVAPLFDAVWPPEVRATFPWAHVVWANAMEQWRADLLEEERRPMLLLRYGFVQ